MRKLPTAVTLIHNGGTVISGDEVTVTAKMLERLTKYDVVRFEEENNKVTYQLGISVLARAKKLMSARGEKYQTKGNAKEVIGSYGTIISS